jgi:glycosyltransferase involved in cell wall biosynthesis
VNILFLEQNPRFVGGSERIGLSLCTEMHRLGHSTHLLYQVEGDMVAAFSQVTASVTRARVRPLAVRHPLEAVASLSALRKVVAEHRIDIVFTSQVGYVSLLAVARLFLGVRSLVHLGLALSFVSPLYRWGMSRIAATVTPSEPMRKACIALGWPAKDLHVVANGVDLERFHPVVSRGAMRVSLRLPVDVPLIAYVGRLVEEKGIFTLMRAAASLKARRHAFHLVVVGSAPGDEDKVLASMAANLGLGPDCVSMRRATDRPEDYFAAADVAVIPSEWPEPFGLAAIEAMACGCVPVVSDAGILPEIIGTENAACVFPKGDADQLADRIAFVLSDPAARASISAGCMARVRQHYGLEDCGRAYEAIMREVGARHG